MCPYGWHPRGVLAVFDVDGVVADVRHRVHHVIRAPKNWVAFFAAAAADPPLPVGVELAREWLVEHELVWLTGRPERLRRITQQWLRRHGLPADRLVMRPDGDRRAAKLFKAEQVATLARGGEVAVVVDDDPEVVALLHRRGWPVYLADWAPREPALWTAQERDGRT